MKNFFSQLDINIQVWKYASLISYRISIRLRWFVGKFNGVSNTFLTCLSEIVVETLMFIVLFRHTVLKFDKHSKLRLGQRGVQYESIIVNFLIFVV